VTQPTRCKWAQSDLAIAYHDTEWGVPQHDDRVLFEFLVLEGAQAGLSWETILKKRANYRQAFFDFDPIRVAKMTPSQVEKLLAEEDPTKRIVRNRAKVLSAVANARAFLTVAQEFGSFDAYVWRFVDPSGDKSPRINQFTTVKQVPANTPESDALCKDLRARGFSFVGSTICYAFMQAVGMVNDHTTDCYRHHELA
jgi:DNA-3-methyladenine glycosylase I